MMSESALYAYATKNGDLVKDLKLVRHPEGGSVDQLYRCIY